MQTTLKLKRNLILPSFHSVIRINDGGSVLRLRMLRLRRLNLSYHRGQNTPHNHFVIFAQRTSSMADTNKEVERREKQPPAPPDTAAEKEKERPPKKKQLPPPPEKPEAGDCCGSGCVRCVWDIYYDELDAYDQLVKEFNQSPDSV